MRPVVVAGVAAQFSSAQQSLRITASSLVHKGRFGGAAGSDNGMPGICVKGGHGGDGRMRVEVNYIHMYLAGNGTYLSPTNWVPAAVPHLTYIHK